MSAVVMSAAAEQQLGDVLQEAPEPFRQLPERQGFAEQSEMWC